MEEVSQKTRKKPMLKHIISNLARIFKGRLNHVGFKWVNAVTVLNENYLNRLPVQKQAYIPNSMLPEKVEFSWDMPFVFWVANFKAQKRPELCIELAKSLEDLDYDLIMVGGIQDQSYNYFQSADNLPANLHYLGPKTVEEVNGILFKSTCMVHTCKPEGFGNNFIQAWLQGKPVVSYEFDPGGLIESKGLGFVSEANMDKFVTDTIRLISDRSLNKEMGAKAKSYAYTHFHPETNVRKLEQFMLETIGVSRKTK